MTHEQARFTLTLIMVPVPLLGQLNYSWTAAKLPVYSAEY